MIKDIKNRNIIKNNTNQWSYFGWKRRKLSKRIVSKMFFM
jgi:hypothetical protein